MTTPRTLARLNRQQRIRHAITDGLAFARQRMHDPSDTDIAICIEVQLREAGVRLSLTPTDTRTSPEASHV
jgi:ssRNA-specific RNase YbeY (16S rRNA maturation enzyme)